ncbi:MAG: hypothetical protein AB8B35_07580 [Prochlorococcus sp.]|jgi:hypothetical protein
MKHLNSLLAIVGLIFLIFIITEPQQVTTQQDTNQQINIQQVTIKPITIQQDVLTSEPQMLQTPIEEDVLSEQATEEAEPQHRLHI